MPGPKMLTECSCRFTIARKFYRSVYVTLLQNFISRLLVVLYLARKALSPGFFKLTSINLKGAARDEFISKACLHLLYAPICPTGTPNTGKVGIKMSITQYTSIPYNQIPLQKCGRLLRTSYSVTMQHTENIAAFGTFSNSRLLLSCG